MCATHANLRALTPTPATSLRRPCGPWRSGRGFWASCPSTLFLDANWKRGMERLPLEAFLRQKRHAEALLGPKGVGLGTDWDGGFGLEAVPLGLDRHRDLWRLGDEAFLGENWLRWLLSWF